MTRETVSFGEFEAYVAQMGDEASKITGLPTTKVEFDLWWQRISVSNDLRTRWTRRIRLGEKLIAEIGNEIEAIRRAA